MQDSKATKTQGVTGGRRIRKRNINNEREVESVIRKTVDSD